MGGLPQTQWKRDGLLGWSCILSFQIYTNLIIIMGRPGCLCKGHPPCPHTLSISINHINKHTHTFEWVLHANWQTLEHSSLCYDYLTIRSCSTQETQTMCRSKSDCDTLPPPASNFPIAEERKEWSDTEGRRKAEEDTLSCRMCWCLSWCAD